MGTVVTAIVSGILFLGGFALFAIAFEVTAFMPVIFFLGILAIALSIIIPAHLLPAID